MRIRLDKLVKPELELLRESCNFTFEEEQVFDFLSKGRSIREISMRINCSEPTVSRRIRTIKDKIERVGVNGKSTNLGKSDIIS